MSKEIERGFAYQPNEPTPDNPSEILMGISFGGVNYIDVEDYKKLQETLKNTYETGQEIACELEKENQQLKSVLNEVREYVKNNIQEGYSEVYDTYIRWDAVSGDGILDILNKVGDK